MAAIGLSGKLASDLNDPTPGHAGGKRLAADFATAGTDAAAWLTRAAADADPRLYGARRLAHSVAHDFNNVLTVVLGNLHVLKRCSGDDAVAKLAEAATNAALRGADLAKRLHGLADGPNLDRSPVDINAVVVAMDGILRRAAGPDIRVTTTLADDVPHGFTDPVLLEAAILSLAANARDAMPAGGTLSIDTARVGDGGDRSSAGAYACVAVGDDGRGMAPEEVERAFEPFYTTRLAGKGSGLGLSLVAALITGSDGRLSVASQPGHGTRISMFLPAGRGDAWP